MAASLVVLGRHVRKTLLNVNNVQEGKFAFVSSVVARDLNLTKNVTYINENNVEIVEYPPVKPRYPKGKWDIEPSYAWLWQKTTDDLMGIPDVKGRQEFIINNEMSHLNALPDNDHPNYLEFSNYATKTVLLPWSGFPLLRNNNNGDDVNKQLFDEVLLGKMKNIIIDQILIEHEAVERAILHNTDTLFFEKMQAGLVMRSIFDTLTTNLSRVASHLRLCQYDEEVTVRAVWDRYGIERKRRHKLSPSHYKMDKVLDQRLMSSCTFNGMIRSHLPLPQVHPRNSGLSIESEKPSLKYKPSCYGVRKQAAYKPSSILAGHMLGDPCEYGLVGFLLTNRTKELDDVFGPKVAKECRLGRGLTATFTWLAAQAYNQGFSGFIDLTYPLTSQTVMSDGKRFSFIACQLNTLELWKSDSTNDMVNLCWHTDEMPLYECIENGQVKGFNEDVLKMLVNVFLLEPADRGYDMKPTISEKDTNLHQKCDFIPEKVEQVVEKEEEQYIV